MGTLTLQSARRIAEAEWGSGGTTYYETNRQGTYWFSCSGHGGFVIDKACLSDDEIASLSPHLDMKGSVVLAEEDLCWALIVKFCDIRRLRDDVETVHRYAEATWQSDFNPESPTVIAEARRRQAISDACPDTIISAYPAEPASEDHWWITTGNFRRYRVRGYDKENLSLKACVVIEELELN